MKPWLAAVLRENGYLEWRELADGRVIAVSPMMYTFGLMVGCDESSYEYRYCYERAADARAALLTWDGSGHPPGPWIKRKGHPEGELLGPGATSGQ